MKAGSDGKGIANLVVGGAQLTQGEGDFAGMPLSVGRSRPDQTANLIKAMAMAVGKNLIAYIEVMYPEAIKATSSTFKTSMKNHVYNDIMHVTTLHTEAEIRAWLTENEAHHKRWLGMWRKMRKQSGGTTR